MATRLAWRLARYRDTIRRQLQIENPEDERWLAVRPFVDRLYAHGHTLNAAIAFVRTQMEELSGSDTARR